MQPSKMSNGDLAQKASLASGYPKKNNTFKGTFILTA